MKNLLAKPTGKFQSDSSRFEKFNLRENPFPATPIINQEDNDIRYNGQIFEEKIREDEWTKITENFLKVPQANPNHFRIGYILDTSYVGRGNGKSSFSINLLKTINENFCLDISNNTNKCFGLYVTPEPSGRTKNFYNLVDLLFESICNSNILNQCLATLRLEAIIEKFPDKNIQALLKDESEAVKSLNDIQWFKEHNIEIPQLTMDIFRKTELLQLPNTFPLNRDKHNFYGTRIVAASDIRDYYYNDLKKGKERIEFVFTHLVNFFLASGFNGAYAMIDDFERIPDFQSDRQKREFALELRTNLFDGMTKNAKVGFFNFILILHAGVPRLIEKSWSDTGMEQRSPLTTADTNSRHIIFFEKLSLDHAVLLIKKYLNEYRIKPVKSGNQNDLIFPFDKKAIYKIGEITELNAAGILQKANHLLEKAIEQDLKLIDEKFVTTILGQAKKIEDVSSERKGSDDSIDLIQKSKRS